MATAFQNTCVANLLLLLQILTISFATQDDLVISTTLGKVQGKLLSVPNGEVRAFLGIPYAKPPVGNLRFHAPEPIEEWKGVKEAKEIPNTCYQLPDTTYPGFKGAEMWNPNTPLSEDCLYLNVWSPNFNKSSTLAPVLVWIYGGGYVTGTSSLDIYQAHFLMGAFGFLSLPDNKNIKGNAGLLDQRLALKWVTSNIAAFGGDPSKVTIFGESAGSASVGFHLLSPGSQSFFQRAVMQSGSPNAPWASISQSEIWDRSLMLAKLLNCPVTYSVRLEMCLKQADPQKISEKQYDVLRQSSILSLPFVPNVDGDFLPAEVEVMLNSSNLPKKEVMIGLNKDEGTFFLLYGMPGFDISGESLITRQDFLNGIAITMTDSSHVARQAAIFHYTDWTDEDNGMKNRDSLGSLVGDQIFVCPVLDFALRYSEGGGKTFVYLFDHVSSINPWPVWMGAMHGYEIEFIFGMPLNTSLGYTTNELNMTKKFMKHWANFARTGNPGLDGAAWPVYTSERQEYITLNYNHPEQKKMMRAKECHFWSKLLPQIEKTSDELASCNASGIILQCNWVFLLILLVISFNY